MTFMPHLYGIQAKDGMFLTAITHNENGYRSVARLQR